jgi:hypothetical protein
MKAGLFFLLVLPFFATAQNRHNLFGPVKKVVNSSPFTEANQAISFNPFALAEIDFTALAGYENKIRNNLFLSNEAGYVFASAYIPGNNSASVRASGFLLRPSVKWFVDKNNKFYVQPQVFYKQVTHNIHDWLGKDAVNGVSSYEQLQDFRYRRKIFGFNAIAGFVLALDQHRNGYIDLYFGAGVRTKKNTIVREPRSVYQNHSNGFFTGDPDNGVFPSLPIGIRFIFVLH